MSDILKAVSSGVATFVFAWLLPSAVTVTTFAIVCRNAASTSPIFSGLAMATSDGVLVEAAIFGLIVFSLATLLAYSSLMVYRFLEGYLMPRPVRRWLLGRTRRRWYRLRAHREALQRLGLDSSELDEELHAYPVDVEYLLPTRLGNALKASETFGLTRFGLNSQQLWYELRAVVSDSVRNDVAQTRAVVDLFVSLVSHLVLLALACVAVAAWYGALGPLLVAGIAAVCVRPAYNGSVRNMIDWQYAMQAMVNLGRRDLATALGFTFPHTFELERWLWNSLYWKLERNDGELDVRLDQFRIRYPDEDSDYVAGARATYASPTAESTETANPEAGSM